MSVVVLDNVGLAEDLPSLPLNVLHPLLEDGTAGNNCSVEVSYVFTVVILPGHDIILYHADFVKVVDCKDRVAFIGISNWALDPAKMNRGIMVTRCDPNESELERSAK